MSVAEAPGVRPPFQASARAGGPMSTSHDRRAEYEIAPEPAALPAAEAGRDVPPMLAHAGATLGRGVLQRKLARRRSQRRADEAPAGEQQAPAEVFAHATGGGGAEVPHRAEMERAFGQDFSSVRAH